MNITDQDIYVYKLWNNMNCGVTAKELANITRSSASISLCKLHDAVRDKKLKFKFEVRNNNFVKVFYPTPLLIKHINTIEKGDKNKNEHRRINE